MSFFNPPNLVAIKSATTSSPPVSPNTTDIYLIPVGATGAWTGHDNQLTRYNGATWDFVSAYNGFILWVMDSPIRFYQYDSTTGLWTDSLSGGGGVSGTLNRYAYFNTTTSLGSGNLKQVSSKVGVISGTESPSATFQVLRDPPSFGAYSFSNWNSTSQAIPTALGCPTSNGGHTLASFFPALVLFRDGVPTESYDNYAEFKIGRWEDNNVFARTGLTIALTHGSSPAAGTDCLDIYSDGRLQTYGSVLHINKGAANTNNVDIKVSSAANPPALRWNGSTTKWQLTNDGTTFFDIASSASGISGSGTANRLVKWTSASDITSSSLGREANSRLGVNMTADPTTSSGRFQINDFPASGGSTISFGNWNSTGNAIIAAVAEPAATNGGNTIASPFPVVVFSLSGVSGQSSANTGSIAMTRYSTANTSSNTRLVIQANVGSNAYPVDTMSFYGTGRAGIGNGTVTTSGNDAKTLFHVGGQLVNAGTNYSTEAWGGGGGPLVPMMIVYDASDSTSTTMHPQLVLGKKGVASGQEACRAEFGLGRYESSSNAPRTRMDIRLGHATNETTPPRIASFMSYGGFGVGQTTGINSANDNPAAVLQCGNTPTDLGSYSLTSWNSTGSRVHALFVSPNTNGGSSPSTSEPAMILSRRGVAGQAFANFAEFKLARYENVSTNARTELTIALTNASEAAGVDVLVLRSNKTALFKGEFGGPQVTTTSGNVTVDWGITNQHEHTASGNVTFTFSNAIAGHIYTLIFKENGTGGFTWTFPSTVKWAGGTAPAFTTTANVVHSAMFYFDGTNFLNLTFQIAIA